MELRSNYCEVAVCPKCIAKPKPLTRQATQQGEQSNIKVGNDSSVTINVGRPLPTRPRPTDDTVSLSAWEHRGEILYCSHSDSYQVTRRKTQDIPKGYKVEPQKRHRNHTLLVDDVSGVVVRPPTTLQTRRSMNPSCDMDFWHRKLNERLLVSVTSESTERICVKMKCCSDKAASGNHPFVKIYHIYRIHCEANFHKITPTRAQLQIHTYKFTPTRSHLQVHTYKFTRSHLQDHKFTPTNSYLTPSHLNRFTPRNLHNFA